MFWRSAECFQFGDKAADDAEALRPESRVGGIESERRQELAVAQRAAGPKQVEIALGKALMRVLIVGVKRIHQAIAERIGVDIERRMNEMRDVGPVIPVGVVKRQGRPKALALHVEPDVADALGGQLAAATFV